MPQELDRRLQESVIGQEGATQTLAVAACRHYLARGWRQRRAAGALDHLGRRNVLLVGPSGSGKTFMVRTLARLLQVPFAAVSATSLVEVGYKGRHVESLGEAVLLAADGNLEAARHGILFLDELDKCRRSPLLDRDVSGEGVQNALLTLLEGQRLPVRRGYLDTGELFLVCAGAFRGLGEIISARLMRQAEPLPEHVLDAMTAADLVEAGLIPELVGRFGCIAATRPLGRLLLRRVLAEGRESPLACAQEAFRLHGVELEVTAGGMEALAGAAEAEGLGARSLELVLGRVLQSVEILLEELTADGVDRVVVDAGAVRRRRPRLERRGRVRDNLAPRLRAQGLGVLPGPDPKEGPPEDLVRRCHRDLRVAEAPPEARSWWRAYVRSLEANQQLAELEKVHRDLSELDCTLQDLWTAHERTRCRKFSSLVRFLAFLREARQNEEENCPWLEGGEERPS